MYRLQPSAASQQTGQMTAYSEMDGILAGIGRSSFDGDTEEFDDAAAIVNAFADDAGDDSIVEAAGCESEDFDADAATAAL